MWSWEKPVVWQIHNAFTPTVNNNSPNNKQHNPLALVHSRRFRMTSFKISMRRLKWEFCSWIYIPEIKFTNNNETHWDSDWNYKSVSYERIQNITQGSATGLISFSRIITIWYELSRTDRWVTHTALHIYMYHLANT